MLASLLAADGALLLFIQNVLRAPWLNRLMVGYTTLGNTGLLWIALCLIFLFFARTRLTGALGLLSIALGALITNVTLKNLLPRLRPYLTVEGLTPLLEMEHDPASFPSGHTTAAFAFAFIVWRVLGPKAGGAAFAAAFLMGVSRLYVGVHFPSDVLAGALIGSLAGAAVWQVYLHREKRRPADRRGGAQ